MKFGKEFKTHLEETIPVWRDKFLCYKPLKKLLKHHFPNPATPDSDLHPNHLNNTSKLDKFNDFYVDKEKEFIIRFQEQKERIEQVKQKSSKGGVFTSESEFSEEMMEIRKDFVTIHGEMVLLKNYSSLNFAGLVKILKKYDKRTGGLLSNISPKTPSTLAEETVDLYRSTIAAMKAIRGLQKASSTRNPMSFSSLYRNREDESNGAVTAETSASNSSASLHTGKDGDHEDSHSV
ncbi:hypothetical protein I3760_04G015100 [Carya illinoinensis]|nr:hypothetical protein I3760_04G015100 [Carya illinoinensis]